MVIVKYILKRIAQTMIVLFFVSLFAFFIIRIAPGNPARMVLPDGATEEQVAAMEAKLGLDRPLYEQYLRYMGGVLRGNLGISAAYGTPCKDLIFGRLPATIKLAVTTYFIALLIAVPLGIAAGSHQGTIWDFCAMLFALIGQSIAPLWLGILLMYLFAVKLGWLPAMGYGGIVFLIMPAFALGYPNAAQLTRLCRSSMIDILHEDYITATYAKGMSNHEVNTKYAFKNALIPVITMVGMDMGVLMTGAVVIETLFAWPGIGQLSFQAIGNRYYQLVQSLLLVSATIIALVNLLVDIVNSFIDPRVSLE